MLRIKKGSYQGKILNFILRFLSLTYKTVHLKRHNSFITTTSIGKNTRINGHFRSKGAGELVIGAYCAFGHNIKALTSNHNLNTLSLQVHMNKKLGVKINEKENQGIKIGNNVWIGDNVVILAGVNIGDGSIIGAGSIVTKDIAPFTINAGNPARLIRNRFESEEVTKLLKEVKWWKWSEEKIRSHKAFFESDFNSMPINEIKAVISKL